jgi:hypothetical protein
MKGIEKMKKKNQNNKVKKIKFVQILDITIFLIIILSLSIGIMVLGIETDSSDDVVDYSPEFFSEKYANDANEVLLASTIPRVTYIDIYTNVTEYIGYSINQLIIEDVYLRINSASNLNVTSLKQGIESQIQKSARNLIDTKYDFKLTISTSNLDLFTIISGNNPKPDSDIAAVSSISLLSSDLQDKLEIKLELYY